MNKVKEFLSKYWHTLLAVVALLVVIYLIYWAGKKAGSGNPVVTDDQGNIVNPTPEQTATANTLATRIHEDLDGYDFFGTLGRDVDAYTLFSGLSDTMFTYVYQRYKAMFGSSIIADIREESSISGATIVDLIIDRANRLNLT